MREISFLNPIFTSKNIFILIILDLYIIKIRFIYFFAHKLVKVKKKMTYEMHKKLQEFPKVSMNFKLFD